MSTWLNRIFMALVIGLFVLAPISAPVAAAANSVTPATCCGFARTCGGC